VSQELLWLFYRGSLQAQIGEHPMLENSIQGLVRDIKPGRTNVCMWSELQW
jgi:hypothetical protein